MKNTQSFYTNKQVYKLCDLIKKHVNKMVNQKNDYHTEIIYLGLFIMLSVYYLNYISIFHQGVIIGQEKTRFLLKLCSTTIICIGLSPYKFKKTGCSYLYAYLYLYLYLLVHFVLNNLVSKDVGDYKFANILLELPILLALAGTSLSLELYKLIKFISITMVLQTLIDSIFFYNHILLWNENTFVGGLGNPSSFGLLCSLGLYYCLFYDEDPIFRVVTGSILLCGVLMSKSLFSSIASVAGILIWLIIHIRQKNTFPVIAFLIFIVSFFSSEQFLRIIGFNFLKYKFLSMLSIFGINGYIEYSDMPSMGVLERVSNYNNTISEMYNSPISIIFGNLGGLSYWPSDSQVVAYFGSFGILGTSVFICLHIRLLSISWKLRKSDNRFLFSAFCLFGLIFMISRVLDYFPIGIVYFLLISLAQRATNDIYTSQDSLNSKT